MENTKNNKLKNLKNDNNEEFAKNLMKTFESAYESVDEFDKNISKVLEAHPNHPMANFFKGFIQALHGDFEKSLEFFNRGLKSSDGNPIVKFARALAKLHLNKPEECLKDLEEVVKANPKFAFAYSFIGGILEDFGKYEDALKAYKKMAEIAPNPYAYYKIASLLYNLGKHEESLRYLDEALKIDSKFVSALILKAEILLSLNKISEALLTLKKALDIRPDNTQALFVLGLIHLRIGEFDEAINAFNKVLEKNSYHILSMLGKAIAYERKGLMEKAIELYNRVFNYYDKDK
ncbi:tetratricopeptide repeat protein [Methanocaldococcus fervens]|uniref:Tetratricopeptide TPR_2 repeat protein n=1 Tax=Methanocaldococcus fervens (strain DSM 4213 / JCM 15782 / AG86) TaxID=573064 RepID=C7P7B7_METFA|nr:tetratricopeptide repeat protein [Methanocaldococcus fervens]ACV24449.1 Tetratricopeptide TPR_2 repeat protein [Methanocaldococcus fervens AG86]